MVEPLRDVAAVDRIAVEQPLTDFLDGAFEFEPEPDYVLYQDGEPILVADAKWKDFSGKPNREDLYQMIGYQQYFDVPGVLLYPNTSSEIPTKDLPSVDIKHGQRLYVAELPVVDSKEHFGEYRSTMVDVLDGIVTTALPD